MTASLSDRHHRHEDRAPGRQQNVPDGIRNSIAQCGDIALGFVLHRAQGGGDGLRALNLIRRSTSRIGIDFRLCQAPSEPKNVRPQGYLWIDGVEWKREETFRNEGVGKVHEERPSQGD